MSGDVFCLNNIILESTGKSSLHIGAADNVVCINNIIYGNSDWQEIDTRSHNIYTALSWSQTPSWGWELEEGGIICNGVYDNPNYGICNIFDIFVDPDKDDYTLKQGSPAIDNGIDITSYLPTSLFLDFDFGVDIIGNSRPQGVEWDIGAYEYVGGA